MIDIPVVFLFFVLFLQELFVGALLILCFKRVVAAEWIKAVEGPLRDALHLSFLLPFLFLLLYFMRSFIYSWTDPDILIGEFQRSYFHPTHFLLRNIAYFALWLFLAHRILQRKITRGAFPLVLILLTGTFFSSDWIMSLDLQFKSTIFGLIFLLSSLLAMYGYALALIPHKLPRQILSDLNNIHLSLIAVWTYLWTMQYLIIWSSNLPAEAHWYVTRISTSWKYLPLLIMVCQCAIPLVALLFRKWKSSIQFTKYMGLNSLLMQMVFLFWITIPQVYPEEIRVPMLGILTFIVMIAGTLLLMRRKNI